MVGAAVALHRRPASAEPSDPVPEWLVRLVGRHWAVALVAGGVMLTYSVTIVAVLEILKANVGALDRAIAVALFGLTSIITITAPILYTVLAPPGRGGSGALAPLAHRPLPSDRGRAPSAIGIAIMLKAAYDLAAEEATRQPVATYWAGG